MCIRDRAGGVHDRLIAQLQHLEAGVVVGLRARLGGADDGGHPAVGAGGLPPRRDRRQPRRTDPDRVTRRQAHPRLDAIGDGRLPVGAEDDGLVATQGEVRQGVRRAVPLDEHPQGLLLGLAETVDRAARPEQHDRRRDQRDRGEDPDHEADHAARLGDVVPGELDAEHEDLPEGPGQRVLARQSSRGRPGQAPADQRRPHQPDDQCQARPQVGPCLLYTSRCV